MQKILPGRGIVRRYVIADKGSVDPGDRDLVGRGAGLVEPPLGQQIVQVGDAVEPSAEIDDPVVAVPVVGVGVHDGAEGRTAFVGEAQQPHLAVIHNMLDNRVQCRI